MGRFELEAQLEDVTNKINRLRKDILYLRHRMGAEFKESMPEMEQMRKLMFERDRLQDELNKTMY